MQHIRFVFAKDLPREIVNGHYQYMYTVFPCSLHADIIAMAHNKNKKTKN